jgi:hypothetical protein
MLLQALLLCIREVARVDCAHAHSLSNSPLAGEVGGQRVTFGHVSNHPFPNRTGDFHRIRLSRPSVHLPWPDVPSGTAQVLYHLSSPEPLPLVSGITPII